MAAGKNKFKDTPKIEDEDPFIDSPAPDHGPKVKAKKPKAEPKAKAESTGPNGIVRFFGNEKVHKIFALLLLAFSVIQFVAFASFMLTWQNDISELDRPLDEILFSPTVKVENWLGKIGALLSNQFINNWFGVAAFIIPFLFFVCGLYILTKIKLVPIKRSFAYSLFFYCVDTCNAWAVFL